VSEDTKEANSEATEWAALRSRAAEKTGGHATHFGGPEALWEAALNEYWRLKGAGLPARHCCWQFRYLLTVPELSAAAEMFLDSHGCAIKSRTRGSLYATQ